MSTIAERSVIDIVDSKRVTDLRARVRDAMEVPPEPWICPDRLPTEDMSGSVAVRKARAIAQKLNAMPTDLWDGQLIAGSLTLEDPRIHAEYGFPVYLTAEEQADADRRGLSTGCFGHIVPDYPKLLRAGLAGIRQEAAASIPHADSPDERNFLQSVIIALDGAVAFARRLSERCASEANATDDPSWRDDLLHMSADLRVVPEHPAQTFRQALQSVWILHMIFHSTKNNNALGRLDQYARQYLEDDLASGTITLEEAAELVDCFTLKFNERAKTTDDQATDQRSVEELDLTSRTRHGTSSQIGGSRDRIDATNHWLQNIIISGLTPSGEDGTNLLSHLLLRSFSRNRMTNPLITVRLHKNSPADLVSHACEVLKTGGGMPAFFNDEALIPALVNTGIPLADARDYTNDGCWEVIIPGRTDFKFQRMSLMLCLEWALNRGITRRTGKREGVDTGDPRLFRSFDDVWNAFSIQLREMIRQTVQNVIDQKDSRNHYAPVPLLSALIDGSIGSKKDMTSGGARFRTYGMLAESAAHAIDSISALKFAVFENGKVSFTEVCDALDSNFEGYDGVKALLRSAPKYGNDDDDADAVGRRVIELFTGLVSEYAAFHRGEMLFPCGVGTFSWYIGIGEGLGASPDGRLSGSPVSSNFSPALGRDMNGLPPAILSYGKMCHEALPAGGPIDLRIAGHLIGGEDGTERMAGLVRGFVETGGSMMTLTVADAEELRAAQADPDNYRSLRVRMGGWCAYFTMLSSEQQEHQIRRQEGRG